MGDLGNVIADEKGRAEFQFDDNLVKVNDIIGRSIVISNGSDDLGRGMSEMSKVVYFSTDFRNSKKKCNLRKLHCLPHRLKSTPFKFCIEASLYLHFSDFSPLSLF